MKHYQDGHVCQYRLITLTSMESTSFTAGECDDDNITRLLFHASIALFSTPVLVIAIFLLGLIEEPLNNVWQLYVVLL